MAQQIIHNYEYYHPIFRDIEKLYLYLSEKQPKSMLPMCMSYHFRKIIDLFKSQPDTYYKIKYIHKEYPKIEVPKFNKKNLILCFSGGRDSLAAALHYKKLGYNITLYHLKGINKVYTDEWESAKRLADQLELPIAFETVKLSGKQEWIEHPLKNWIIMSMALQYGLRNKLTTKIATGNFYTSSIYTDIFAVCGGDCMEMWYMYQDIIRTVIRSFRVFVCNRNIATTFNALLKNPEFIENCNSCMSPVRFKNQLRKKNINKYGFPKLKNRCGSCWKCCYEYIFLCDHGLAEYNKDYYRHCLDILRHDFKKEHGYAAIDIWSEYFFYDRRKGKYNESVI